MVPAREVKGQSLFLVIPIQKGWEKIGNVSLESCNQIIEDTRRIQDLVWFIDI